MVFLDLGAQSNVEKEAMRYFDLAEEVYERSVDSCIHYTYKALPLCEQAGLWEAYVNCWNGLYYCYRNKATFAEASKAVHKALEAAQKHLDPNNSAAYRSAVNNYGVYHTEIGELDKALNLFRASEQREGGGEGAARSRTVYQDNIAAIYSIKGDYATAREYILYSLKSKEKLLGENSEDVAYSYLALAEVEGRLYGREKAMELFRKADQLFEKQPKETQIYGLYDTYGKMVEFLMTEQEDVELQFCYRHLEMLCFENDFLPLYPYTLQMARKGQYCSFVAKDVMREIQRFYPDGVRNMDYAAFYLAVCREEMERNPNKSLAAAHKALRYCLKGNEVTLPELALEAMQRLGGLYERLGKDAKSDFYYVWATKTIDQIRRSYTSEGSKLLYSGELSSFFEEAIRAQRRPDGSYAELAFWFTECAKAAVLSENLDKINLSKQYGISAAEESEMQSWKQEFAFLSQNPNTDKRRFELRKLIDTRESQWRMDFPDYRNAQKLGVTVEELQQTLQRRQAVLSFYELKDSVFVHVITYDIHRTMMLSKLELLGPTQMIVKEIKNKEFYKQPPQQLAQRLHQLAQILLGTKDGALGTVVDDRKIKEWSIMPMGATLSSFPFEILPINESETFLHRFAVSYAYSANTLLKSRRPIGPPRYSQVNVFAFAPFTESLPNTWAETGLWTVGKVVRAKRYNDSAFAEAKLLHLATHAEAPKGHEPYIRLDDKTAKIGMEELGLKRLNARMAILSACETASGEHAQGEGVLSMSRAFAKAGCPALTSTLWPLEDKAAYNILRFYTKGLEDGLPPDQALRMSKLHYLKTADAYEGHPYFWAGMLHYGSTEPLHFLVPEQNNWWVLGALSVLLLALLKKS